MIPGVIVKQKKRSGTKKQNIVPEKRDVPPHRDLFRSVVSGRKKSPHRTKVEIPTPVVDSPANKIHCVMCNAETVHNPAKMFDTCSDVCEHRLNTWGFDMICAYRGCEKLYGSAQGRIFFCSDNCAEKHQLSIALPYFREKAFLKEPTIQEAVA
jgi:hypothetical protein